MLAFLQTDIERNYKHSLHYIYIYLLVNACFWLKKRKWRHTKYSYTTSRERRKKTMIMKNREKGSIKAKFNVNMKAKWFTELEIWSVMHVTLVALQSEKSESVVDKMVLGCQKVKDCCPPFVTLILHS